MAQQFLLFVVFLVSVVAQGSAQEPARFSLSPMAADVNEADWQVAAKDITPGCQHAWSVKKFTLNGGRQQGVETIVVNNGEIEIVICPTRGMGILSVRRGDLWLKWDSPVKEIVHPQFVNLSSRGGLGWLEGFNEFMCRCGLESNGHPGTDKFINNTGDQAEMELTLHGKISNIPASNVEIVVDRTAPYAIHVKALVTERFMFGPKLELHTELVVVPGESTFDIVDEIKNTGAQEQEFQIIYHANFGSPLLEQGAKVLAPASKIEPFNDRAAEGIDNWNTYDAPTTGFVEQVYLLTPKADEDNRTTALIHSKAMDKAASISWSLDQLPYLTVWKNTGAKEDGYVTGIEPGTNYPNNRSVERKAGRVPKLKPGQSRKMKLTFGLHNGTEEVKEVVTVVNALGLVREGVDNPSSISVPKQ